MDMMDGLSCDLMKFILIGLYSLLVDTVCLFLDKSMNLQRMLQARIFN